MNKRTFLMAAVILVLVLASLACSFNFSTAAVENLRMAKDEGGSQATTQFAPTDPFYLVGDLKNAPEDTKLKAVWTAVEVEGADPNTLILEKEEAGGSGPFWFNLTSDSGSWPVGKYKVDLYMNDELNSTLEFEVNGG